MADNEPDPSKGRQPKRRKAASNVGQKRKKTKKKIDSRTEEEEKAASANNPNTGAGSSDSGPLPEVWEGSKPNSSSTAEKYAEDECPVCLDPPVHGIQLECKHTFCFLCAKGLVESGNASCSLCRKPIPPDYFKNPALLKRSSIGTLAEAASTSNEGERQLHWFYEGRNGWWRFEERNSLELETLYQEGHQQSELLICGQLYVIDFGTMTQCRKDCSGRKRKIKRDDNTAPSKGVAGLVQDS